MTNEFRTVVDTGVSSIRHCLALSLWKVAKSAAAPTVFALASGKHEDVLAALLHDAGQIKLAGDEEFDVSKIEIQLRRIADRPTTVIQLPRTTYDCFSARTGRDDGEEESNSKEVVGNEARAEWRLLGSR